ncbi:MAG: hypothetical protein R2795_17470 [Saprospiraceae bacterium]
MRKALLKLAFVAAVFVVAQGTAQAQWTETKLQNMYLDFLKGKV